MISKIPHKQIFLLSLVLIIFAAAISGCSSNSENFGVIPTPTKILHTKDIINQEVVIKPGEVCVFTVNVPYDANSPELHISFRAYGGSGNDIKVYVFDEDNYINWENGHSVTPLYDTGKETVGDFSVPVTSGETYYIVLDNSFSVISKKYVKTHIYLTYYQ